MSKSAPGPREIALRAMREANFDRTKKQATPKPKKKPTPKKA
jgi:hypothetical protein